MITHLKGQVFKKDLGYVILEVGGVGYRVFVSTPTSNQITGGEVSLWIHMSVRETSQDLFGFLTEDELSFFEMLIGVSGVGPKSALSITGVAPIDTLRKSIGQGDISHLTGVSGIGKRTAEKIVVELKDKLSAMGWNDEDGSLQQDLDTAEALVALGYGKAEVREALKNIPDSITSTNDKIKEALKNL
jgi:Holliday junction DNA helicase RuvA